MAIGVITNSRSSHWHTKPSIYFSISGRSFAPWVVAHIAHSKNFSRTEIDDCDRMRYPTTLLPSLPPQTQSRVGCCFGMLCTCHEVTLVT
ncbi:hypothetical protein E2C01_044689 [Portunus trituberculatus]|uniref:Uncharacterized protein n=1 Tax=Portunus trituberculatus TaxID=210409 RepID=A0A5B7FZW5_PORTR|nr:hypothetical protein [Portunus trituberculatus]